MIYSPINTLYFDNPTADPGDVVVTDLDRDGLPELTTTFFEFPGGQDLTMVVYEINPDGTVTDIAGELAIGEVPTDVFGRENVAADLNGDGYEDYIVADHGTDLAPFPGAQNTVWLSNGEGGYVDASADFSQDDDFTHSVAAGDIDGDGRQDVFFNNLNIDDAYVATVNRDGSVVFDAIDVTGITIYSTVELADLDGDGMDEVILGDHGSGNPSVVGDWNGNELVYTDLPGQDHFSSDAINVDSDVVDINGDGLQDIVFTQTGSDPFYIGATLQFLIQQPDGSFIDDTDSYWDSGLHSQQENWEYGVTFADLDQDGDLDFFTEPQYPQPVRVFLQDETGRFEVTDDYFGDTNERAVLVDMDFDGVDEIALVGRSWIKFYDSNVTPYNDIYEGDAGPNIFLGTAAFETFYGYERDDHVEAGSGDDTLHGGRGRDSLYGGAGDDTLFGDAHRDRLKGGDGDDELRGGLGKDKLFGGAGQDLLRGGEDVDRMSGGKHDDKLRGGDGGDYLRGRNGYDELQGNAGDDTLNGGRGRDTLTGGEGFDIFSVSRNGHDDTVTDFDIAEDQIQLARLDQFADFDAVLAAMSDDGTDTLIAYDGGSMLLENVTVEELTADHFIL